MRKMLLVLFLVDVTVLASSSELFAQYRSYSNRGENSSFSFGVGHGGYYSPYGYGEREGWGYSPWHQGLGYGYAPSYYSATLGYSDYSAANYLQSSFQQPSTQIRQSFYNASATGQQSVRMTVLVPAPNAQVWFNNGATAQQGVERVFQSPPLEPNRHFTYSIRARWVENGQVVNRERLIDIQSGQNIMVNFRENNGETLPPPLPVSNAMPRE